VREFADRTKHHRNRMIYISFILRQWRIRPAIHKGDNDMSEIVNALGKLSSAEEFMNFLGVEYDQHVVNVNRLHILKRSTSTWRVTVSVVAAMMRSRRNTKCCWNALTTIS